MKIYYQQYRQYYIAAAAILMLLALGGAAFSFLSSPNKMDSNTKRKLSELRKITGLREYYSDSLQAVIDSLDKDCYSASTIDKNAIYHKAQYLYTISKLYSFEYSKKYLDTMIATAHEIGDSNYIAESHGLRAFNYARAGFFHEALDSLNAISIEQVNDSVKSAYFIICGRVYHDLADYTHDDKYTPYYNNTGNENLSKALELTDDSLTIYYLKGKISLKSKLLDDALANYLNARRVCPESNVEMKSVINTTLAHIYRRLGDEESATRMYIESCQIDLVNGHRDMVSLRGLAEMLYNYYGDIDQSSKYIQIAVENAQSYGTRSRINNIGALMPLFVGQKIKKDETTKYILIGLVSFVALLLILLSYGMFKYQARNRQLHQSNNLLNETNNLLNEANKMKETYLGLFLNTQSELSLELNNFAVVANQKLKLRQYDSLKKLLDEMEKKHNKAEVLKSFDQIFSSLFPNFVTQFNALLLPENVMIPKYPGEIPAMMRIFALIRLGITDNNQIARALNYSYNTVHNYRVRVRNMSLDPQNFEKNVMEIT